MGSPRAGLQGDAALLRTRSVLGTSVLGRSVCLWALAPGSWELPVVPAGGARRLLVLRGSSVPALVRPARFTGGGGPRAHGRPPLRARPSTQPTLPLCSGPLVRSQPGQLTTHGGTGQRERPPALSATARTQRKQRTSAPAPGRLPACSGNLNAPALQKETVTALKSSGTTDKCYTLPGRSHHPRH